MFNIFLTLQVIIVILMVLAILLQKNGEDSLAGLSGSGTGIVSARNPKTFNVSLIPYTLEHTNLGELKVGDSMGA